MSPGQQLPVNGIPGRHAWRGQGVLGRQTQEAKGMEAGQGGGDADGLKT